MTLTMVAAAQRRCGDCTVCCVLPPIDALGKAANEKCAHCDGGCTIYDSRPSECALFDCAYLQSSAPLSMRPDKCGIVFEKLSDRIFFGTVFKDPTKEAVGQVDAFVEQGFSVFLVSNTQQFPLTAQIAAGHDEAEVRAEFSGHVEARR